MIGAVTDLEEKEPETLVVWKPLAGSQELAVSCPCNHILYEGSRGPGKTDAQLMFFRRFVGLGYGSFWRGVIFDREYKNLDDLIGKSHKWFPRFEDGAKFYSSKGDYKWQWPSGEVLAFRQIKREADYWGYHGQEFPFIGWNELTKYPTSRLYDLMMSCNRSSFLPQEHSPVGKPPLPEIPLVIFSTTNPYGAGHNWVKKRFIDVASPGRVVKYTTNVFNPRTQTRMDVVKTQARIFGSYKENRYLAPEYVAELERDSDPNKRKAWLTGDWDIVAGGALDDVWDRSLHVLPRFTVPASWRVDRSLDWGSTKPFSVGFWAEANGEEVLVDGHVFAPKKGSLIRFAEWYGTKEIGSNAGLKMSATDVAKGIIERESKLITGGWISKPVQPGPADNSIHDVTDPGTDSIAKKMSMQGVHWTHSDKSPGTRKIGLQLLRDRLQASATGEGPGIYFMDNCVATLATLPVLPRDEDDPDDVDTEAEDHAYDDVRYRVLRGSGRYNVHVPVIYTR